MTLLQLYPLLQRPKNAQLVGDEWQLLGFAVPEMLGLALDGPGAPWDCLGVSSFASDL